MQVVLRSRNCSTYKTLLSGMRSPLNHRLHILLIIEICGNVEILVFSILNLNPHPYSHYFRVLFFWTYFNSSQQR
jgi:hypothetical protein